ncbi:NUDIX domain-containing protein [Patescibacteria group bacterium]
MKNDNQQILISGAVVFRDFRGKRQYILVKQKDDVGWEIPKIIVRKGESSVRASIRMMAEQGGMTAKVLEEAGRVSGSTVVNGKSIPQKYYYYLMVFKTGMGEIIGFSDYQWLEYAKANKILALKREKEMLKGAKDALKLWEKEKKDILG